MAYYIQGISLHQNLRPSFGWESVPPGWTYPFLGGGTPVAAETVPNRAVLLSRHKTIPDFIVLPPAMGVSEAFREMVEDLDPGVHQFFPVTLSRKSGELIDKRYYALNICRRLDAVIVEKSNVTWGRTGLGGFPILHLGAGPPHFTLSRQAIGGAHMWHGLSQFRGLTFFSDALMSRVLGKSMKGLDYFPADESDDPPTAL